MIWKTFLISFILNSGKHKNLILWDSTFTASIPEKIPRRSRSYSDDLENCTDTIKSTINNNNNNFFSKPGYDNRYNGTENDNDIILNITKFNMQMELLKTLENKHVSQHVKIDFIDQYNKNENPSQFMPDIFSGGLYKDWNFDIEK
jgi:hypothetical protein